MIRIREQNGIPRNEIIDHGEDTVRTYEDVHRQRRMDYMIFGNRWHGRRVDSVEVLPNRYAGEREDAA